MQECDACGLLFGGAEECPSCGSRVSHTAPEDIEDGRHGRPTGPLPGDSALDDAISGIEGLDLSISQNTQTSSPSSLPFQVGGKGEVLSTLPFGVGAPAGIIIESDDDLPSDTLVEETPTSQSNNEDPWGLPESESPPILQASSNTVEMESEPPLMVLQARVFATEEEQLSDSPVLVE